VCGERCVVLYFVMFGVSGVTCQVIVCGERVVNFQGILCARQVCSSRLLC